MIIKKLRDVPALWEFMETKLPPSLEGKEVRDGYGVTYQVEIREPKKKIFDFNRIVVGTVSHNLVTLNHPQWFSDIEIICNEYERKYGKEVTIEVWESD